MDSRPHVMQITCHDMGRHLACYGIRTVHTPNLDALAAGGARFRNAFCVSPGCSPSRAALATGRYPHSNGVMGLTHSSFAWDLNPDERHVASTLGEAGYDTHLFGLQHVTTDVGRLGFGTVHGRGTSAQVSGEVVAFLRDIAPQSPLYIEINLFEPHRPYDHGGVQPDTSLGVEMPAYLPDRPESREEMAALQGAIRAADEGIGAILSTLEESGLAGNTLVVFTPDHGIAMPRAKTTLYDPGIEIAMILRWPDGGISGGRIFSELASNVDVLPTILEAVGVEGPDNLQGRSFLPLLRGERYEPRDTVFAEKTFHSYYDPMRAVRTDRYKYIRNFETAFLSEVPGDIQLGRIFRSSTELYSGTHHPDVELYDLRSDPLEQHNLAGAPECAEVERELERRLWGWMEETDDPLLRGPVPSPQYLRQIAAWRSSKEPPRAR